jgi:ABC-type polysaccharide/polyol phosphate transport system ATPase subunit
MSNIAVHVNDVSKKFRLYHERNMTIKSAIMRGRTSVHDDFWALNDVHFDVPQGSTFGLIGSNGSGKSTLLKCLAKIYWPDKGSITHNGKMAALLEVGSGFHHELSGRENIYLNGSILGMSKKEIDSKYDEIVEFSGVERFIDQPVKNYSSGMYVRLGFSIAIHVEPDILVVDEVLAVGDAEFQEKCFGKFRDFKRDGRTVILVSHAMTTVTEMCDQAAWLNQGTLMAVGPVEETVKAYKDSLHLEG